MFDFHLITCSCLLFLFFCLPLALNAQITVIDADGQSVEVADRSRIVALGGPVTEVVCALGLKDKVVATDISSTYPEDLADVPKLGYWRSLAAEGILSFGPTLILVSKLGGPENVIEQLRATGIPVVRVPEIFSVEGAKEKINLLAKVLDAQERGMELIKTLDAQVAQAKSLLHSDSTPQKVLMLYLRGAKVLNAAGTDTPVQSLLEWCNSVNVIQDVDGWKPVNAEAIAARAPEVLLVTTSGLKSVGGVDGLLQIPGIAQTPAGMEKRVIVIDDLLLLGFGPRLGEALIELVKGLQSPGAEQH